VSDAPFTLSQLQNWMQNALHAPSQVPEGQANDVLVSQPRFSGADGLAVYQRSFFLRIVSCMRDQFPALCHALGEQLFDDFVAEYIVVAPPESYTLYDLGRRFPAYLQANRPDSADAREAWIDFIVDLAQFERQVFVMFDAPGAETTGYATTQTPDADLRLQPAVSLGRYRFPVALYYHDVRAKRAASFPPMEVMNVALVRKNYLTQTIALSAAHHLFLTMLSEGQAIDTALENIAAHTGASPDQVRTAWSSKGGTRDVWINAGLFVVAPKRP
jgi:hypothetical protein